MLQARVDLYRRDTLAQSYNTVSLIVYKLECLKSQSTLQTLNCKALTTFTKEIAKSRVQTFIQVRLAAKP